MYAVTHMAARTIQSARIREATLDGISQALGRHPVLTLTAALFLTGLGMALSVAAAAAAITLPMALLLGLI